jgi:hypothetical protein
MTHVSMLRIAILACGLSFAPCLPVAAQSSPAVIEMPAPPPAPPAPPASATTDASAPVPADALPAMHFVSSLAEDELFKLFKAQSPAYAALDDELYGSPLKLVVTHTSRPTAGGQAAGLLSAVISGSTLGIIPMVTNDQLVVRYEVLLNGKVVTSYSFERTATRAINIWGGGGDYGLGKAGLEWVKSTAGEAAAKIAVDPALAALKRELDFYFAPTAASAPAPSAAPAAPASAAPAR